ncbi:MAG: bifunctional DNA-formamidopyrimidine glycosylase/DNA-(apurinic or apyrimidinic site) lyase [Alphaproteobacteria bacterium]|nr:bifunctional DNA-formamidopyrimidine glycosylase/DNA-(apurinic or apyrimidinic site) lyase [Alphaproteobacteria bacterium]
MPELPEVEIACRGLAKALKGKRIARAEQRRKDMRFPLPRRFAARLEGRRILGIARRAKYILAELDKDEILLIHLGMSGRLVLGKDDGAPPARHDHVIFHFADGGKRVLRFNDPRRFGLCDLVPKEELARHKLLRHLGVEPLGPGLTPAWLKEKLRGKKTSIKAALMDQRLIAGLGNIYACEALFYAGISPKRRAGACPGAQIEKLVPAIRKVLRMAIKAGGSSLRDYVQSDGSRGSFQNHFAVYGREGESCPGCACDVKKTGGIRRITQGGRSTFYCPRKQL